MNPSVVTFHYTLRDPSGRVLDTSVGAAPVTYLEGAGQIIDGLDEQLRGAAAGLKTRIQVPAARASGERDPAQVQPVKRSQLPVEGELAIGRAANGRRQTGSGRSMFGTADTSRPTLPPSLTNIERPCILNGKGLVAASENG